MIKSQSLFFLLLLRLPRLQFGEPRQLPEDNYIKNQNLIIINF